jgi:putative Holliday junction resolvase
MRYVGLDIGEKRIGVSISDRDGRVATPLMVLDAGPEFARGTGLARLIEEYEIDAAVIGLPLSMDGEEGPQARRVRTLSERLMGHVGLSYEFFDERLTSSEASLRMREAGVAERDQRGSKDMVAASILLQAFLDGPSGARARGERA